MNATGDGTKAITACNSGYVDAANNVNSPPFDPPMMPIFDAITSLRACNAAIACPTVSTGTFTRYFGKPGKPKYATDAVTYPRFAKTFATRAIESPPSDPPKRIIAG